MDKKVDYDQLRLDNINANEKFIAGLGISRLKSNLTDESDGSQKKRKSDSIQIETTRKSQRLENATNVFMNTKKQEEYTCTICKCPQIFKSKRFLTLHQSRYCNGVDGFVPHQLRPSKSCHILDFLLRERNENSPMSSTNEMMSNSHDMMSIQMPHFDIQEAVVEDMESDVNNGDNLVGEIHFQDNPNLTCISTFQILQESFCDKLFGIGYLECSNLYQIKEVLKRHEIDMSERQKIKAIYSFVAEKGLSRADGNDLLKLIRSFDPRHSVPLSFQGIEKNTRLDAASLYDYIEITIPWIDSWQMHKLPEYPPVKIYCRSMFQIISQMMVDPEIMMIWKEHVFLKYWRAVDKDGQHVFADVMTSPWSEETEKLVHRKDPEGHLMPLIFYTDGVQVSANARNKITPVMVTLGNFSDELLQKDCSKRVIAYLPNFKGNSKDNIKTHLMRTLGICKTSVRY